MLGKNKYIFKWDKYLILLVACGLIITNISGCSTADKLIQEAETSSVVKDAMLITSSNEKDYGDISYEYLEYIQENLSSRTTGTDNEYDTAIFIVNAFLQAYEAAKDLDLDITLPNQGYYELAIATSDHVPFYNAGVPYLFFIAIGPDLKETAEYGTIMHSSRDDLDFIEEAFEGRAKKTLYTYSVLLDYILNHLEEYVGIQ